MPSFYHWRRYSGRHVDPPMDPTENSTHTHIKGNQILSAGTSRGKLKSYQKSVLEGELIFQYVVEFCSQASYGCTSC